MILTFLNKKDFYSSKMKHGHLAGTLHVTWKQTNSKLGQCVFFFFSSFPSSLNVTHIRKHSNMRAPSLVIEMFKVNPGQS